MELAAAVLLLLGALCVGPGASGAPEEDERRRVVLQAMSGGPGASGNLLHIMAVGNGSTLHYAWSTIGTPAVVMVYTESENSRLLVNWTKLMSEEPGGAISVQPADTVRYTTALLFTRIFEYKDVNNTANFSGAPSKDFYPPYDLSDFVWESVNDTLNASSLTASLTGVHANDTAGSFKNGSLTFRISAYEDSGRDLSSPRLLHTANCTKLEFLVSGVRPRGNNSRFALEMMTLEVKEGRKKLRAVHTIDDEYTPTIFEMMELVPDLPNSSLAQGYIQWKSVAYGSPGGARSDAVPCQVSKPRALNQTQALPRILYAFYGDNLTAVYNMEAYNLSFGIADGDFYDKHAFLSWSALVGYGTPPRDSFSILVICIMAVALGTPLLLLIVGSVVVSFIRRRAPDAYQPIN